MWALGSSPASYHGTVCCWLLLLPPASETRFPYPEGPASSFGAPKPPGPAASPDPLAIPKYGVAAECPVDVQVYLGDVPGGDQDLLLHFLWENWGGGAGVRDTDPHLSRAAMLAREPWGHHGSVSCRNPPSFPWEAGHGGSAHHARGTCVRACAQLLWARR